MRWTRAAHACWCHGSMPSVGMKSPSGSTSPGRIPWPGPRDSRRVKGLRTRRRPGPCRRCPDPCRPRRSLRSAPFIHSPPLSRSGRDRAYLLRRVVRVARVRVSLRYGGVTLVGLINARLRVQMEAHTGHASLWDEGSDARIRTVTQKGWGGGDAMNLTAISGARRWTLLNSTRSLRFRQTVQMSSVTWLPVQSRHLTVDVWTPSRRPEMARARTLVNWRLEKWSLVRTRLQPSHMMLEARCQRWSRTWEVRTRRDGSSLFLHGDGVGSR